MYPQPTGAWWYLLVWGVPTLALFLGAWLPHVVPAAGPAPPGDEPPGTAAATALALLVWAGLAVAAIEWIFAGAYGAWIAPLV